MSDSCVYVRDDQEGWLPATVLSHPENQPDRVVVRVFAVDGHSVVDMERTVYLKDYLDGTLPLQNVDASGNFMEMADLVDLPSLHEAAILYNLRARHMARKPYTRVGDLIIAVNPFQWIQDLYSDETRHCYNRLIFDQESNDPTVATDLLPPHVYETAALSYRGLTLNEQHQSILVSGESGAGKTETVKIVMRQLAGIQQSNTTAEPEDFDHSHHIIVQRVLDSHPLLEAFGNAKTVRNDNSSRFGKFIQLQFDVEDVRTAQLAGRAMPHCVMAGSTVETYLLEKSRVVGHDDLHERNYHIFYQLLAATNDQKDKIWKDGLVGKTCASYRYVGETSTTMIEGKTDQERFEKTVAALELMNVKDDKLLMLLKAVCVVMQLGNLVFAEDPNDSEKSIITSYDELQRLAELMGVPSLEDVRKALLFRTVVAGKGETYTVPLRVDDARDGCDAFSKEIYQQIFEWLVRQVNEMTCAEANYEHAAEVEGSYGLIGLLDIFGFESFEVNRFEQLCINYTNEKLQQKYTLDIFRSVQEEYAQEGIALANITYEDNAEVLRLLEGRVGIISILNEECVRPKGNDIAFVAKVKSVNAESKQLIQEKLHKPTEFGVMHYAGLVTYDATNFVQKNTDALPNDLIECACKSSNDLIQVELKAAADAKEDAAGGPAKKRGAATVTVATKFKHQLHQLMHNLSQTQSRYIRCIKPNPEKVPHKMHMLSSTEQLRCAGVVAAVTISRVAFPNRLLHETALERFMCLSSQDLDVCFSEEKKDDEEAVMKHCVHNLLCEILRELEVPSDDDPPVAKKAFECGRSRVYFRAGALEFLERKRLLALGVFATMLQKSARGFVARSQYLKLKSASVTVVACARRVIARKRYHRALSAVVVMECWIRSLFARRELLRLRRQKAATQLQSQWRTAHARFKFSKTKSSAITIQRIGRGAIQRPKYRIALKEAEEEARVNSKLAALQKRLHDAEMKLIKADKMRLEAENRAATSVTVGGSTSPGSEQRSEDKITDDTTAQQPATSLQQQLLIDESNQMLDYFRTEVFKLKSANYLLRNDLAGVKAENQQLVVQNQSLEASVGALRQNIQRLSETNLQIGTMSSRQKDELYKLRQDFKMENLRHASELKKVLEDSAARSQMQDQEISRLKREVERYRRVVAKSTPAPKATATYERAPFAPVSNESTDDPNMSRSSSMVTFEEVPVSSGPDSEVWGHDGYFQTLATSKESGSFDRRSDPKRRSNATWTMLKRKKGNLVDDDSSHSSRAGSKGNDSGHSRSRGNYGGGKYKKPPQQPNAGPVANLTGGSGNFNRRPTTTPAPRTRNPPSRSNSKTQSPPVRPPNSNSQSTPFSRSNSTPQSTPPPRSSSTPQSTPPSRSNSTPQSTPLPRSNSMASSQTENTANPSPTSSLALAASQGKQQPSGKPKKVSVAAGPGGGGGSKGPHNPKKNNKKQ